MLWKDAEHSADDQARTTFQRISDLMQDAMATEIVANDAAPFAVHHNNDTQNNDAQGAPHETIDTLAAMVQDAATNAPEMANTPPSFEEVRTSMDSVSQIKPPVRIVSMQAHLNMLSGQRYSDLVRHVVRDYIHNEVEGGSKTPSNLNLMHISKAPEMAYRMKTLTEIAQNETMRVTKHDGFF